MGIWHREAGFLGAAFVYVGAIMGQVGLIVRVGHFETTRRARGIDRLARIDAYRRRYLNENSSTLPPLHLYSSSYIKKNLYNNDVLNARLSGQ